MKTVLIVDDERNFLVILKAVLDEEGYEVLTAPDPFTALDIVQHTDLDAVVTDMKMPQMDGITLLERIKQINSDLPVIMMTAYGTIEKAVEAMKKGAFDYITKPFSNEELKVTVRKAIDMYLLVKENRHLNRVLQVQYQFGNIIGKSKPMQEVFDLIRKVAKTKATVLITGESGTGKELVAKAIHYNSPRREKPFISVNCAALTETLLESELFGHEKGSFTGAIALRKGRFELADEGTLFLDEVSEMSPSLQVKLLRVLQEREFERVGGTKTIKINVRIIAASNRDLREEVESGRFREDLFYRLNVVHIHLPPLRKRGDDIPLLVAHFLRKYAKEVGAKEVKISPEALNLIYNYSWPGNVRELENAIERAVILSSGQEIKPEHLPEDLRKNSHIYPDIFQHLPSNLTLPQILEEIEARLIRQALVQADYVQSKAARLLGITKSLLQYKIKKYNLLSSK
ncbi:MAG: sigma-54 dependent transcriptional regulator [Candidatus Desulfofervidaceae bacterium]|nr:sigma-54 dependent transcriptional regulator [Candidatus Desulfofervidaceae bacterium]